MGWGILLLVTAVQQATLALTLSPGHGAGPPLHAFVTVAGIAASLLYVRRSQRANPELGLLAKRTR
jgi:hypothetical protein